MKYDKIATSEKFQTGRGLLNTGYYNECIDLFTEIINLTEPSIEEDEESKLTWSTSLNNRGAAKCKLGYSSGDKKLYESGLDDFRTSVNSYPKEQQYRLVAQTNLTYGENEIKDFDARKGVNFSLGNVKD